MSEKSWIDNIFDAADAALTPVEKVLSRDTPAPQKHDPDIIDVEFDDSDATGKRRKEDWESAFKVHHWAVVTNDKTLDKTWHAFAEGKVNPECDPKLVADTESRQVLEHGKRITACSSCIIAVSK